MKDQLRRLMDDFWPGNIGAQGEAFNAGAARVLETIRSNLHADYGTLLEIMVRDLVRG